jgi:aminoglycoside phosphotransferase family enzyme
MGMSELLCVNDLGYLVTDKDEREERTIFFAKNNMVEEIVVKVLHDGFFWRDEELRRKCVLMGYQRGVEVNGEEIYIGVTPIKGYIKNEFYILGPIYTPRCEQETNALLNTRLEYALIMKRLPEYARLDKLLNSQNTQVVEGVLRQTVSYVRAIHDVARVVDRSDQYGRRFGSAEQVINKLNHNIRWFEGSLNQHKLREKYADLVARIKQAWAWEKLSLLLDWRICGNERSACIIEGHGDLHTSNIFCPLKEGNILERVVLLDFIDFYDDYFCIDRLSDIAMLIVDVEAQSGNIKWRELMMEIYLENEPNQAIARYLLWLYMLEKAMVRASVCLDTISSLPPGSEEKENEMLADQFLLLIGRYIEIQRYERYMLNNRLEGLVQP